MHRALTTIIEQVTPEQVPRKEGSWAPGSSVVEFTPKQEKAIEKALSEGKTLPEGQPATLYEALVKDYTGRTPEAQSQTLVITHLNKDRRALNSLIHDARRGRTGKPAKRKSPCRCWSRVTSVTVNCANCRPDGSQGGGGAG